VPETSGKKFERLVEIMARLRAPDGCPWDREQTYDTIKPYTLEETYEVLDAIDRRDFRGLSEELGDFLLQAVFYAQMAKEDGHFEIGAALDAINEKLVRRHPHVFADGDAQTPGEVKKRWDEIKAEEKLTRGEKPGGLLNGIPRAQPGLQEAMQISVKAAGAGFEWPHVDQVFEKVHEEIGELQQARADAAQEEVEAEVGDLLFTIVNLARWLKVDPEQALRRTNAKFRERFRHVEEGLKALGLSPQDASLEKMEMLWQEAKSKSQ
jgi:tetrapyrrole methylase family protein / MazG family protein